MRFLNIKIPSTGLSTGLSQLIDDAASHAVRSTLIASHSKWQDIVNSKLKNSRLDYLNGLNADESMTFPDRYTGVLQLIGNFPQMLETGFSSFDMKIGFKNSPYAKHTKNGGWYMNIPFRHLTPPRNGHRNNPIQMPMDVYKSALKQLRGPGDSLTGTERRHPPTISWTGYQHKSGIYERMIRNRRRYNRSVQSTYFTFRRVSDHSDPSSWMHPGYNGVHAVDDVANYAASLFGRVFNDYLNRSLSGNGR